MSDDLVKRLRNDFAWGHGNKQTRKEAVARIEALEAELHTAHKRSGIEDFGDFRARLKATEMLMAEEYNRGLEDAAEIADRMAQELLSIPKQVAEQIADLIRAKIREEGDD